jgi:phospholipid transport system transporter-binding protein
MPKADGMDVVLALPAELTHRQASSVLGLLLQGLRAGPASHCVIDAGALRVFDSAALAVLLECRRDALAHQKTLSIQDLPPALAGMAALYGVDSLLPAHASGV